MRIRFTILLVLLLLILLSAPLLRALWTHRWLTSGLATLLFTAMLVAAVMAVSPGRRSLRVALVLAVPTIVLDVLDLLSDSAAIQVAFNVCAICFLGYTIVRLLAYLFSATLVTYDTIAASVCAYLILGILWALVFTLVEVLQPGSMSLVFAEDDHADFLGGVNEGGSPAIYFSMVTLTTLGYGDITPVTALARTLAAFEALMGQVYLAVLVARLVGMHISQAVRSAE